MAQQARLNGHNTLTSNPTNGLTISRGWLMIPKEKSTSQIFSIAEPFRRWVGQPWNQNPRGRMRSREARSWSFGSREPMKRGAPKVESSRSQESQVKGVGHLVTTEDIPPKGKLRYISFLFSYICYFIFSSSLIWLKHRRVVTGASTTFDYIYFDKITTTTK